MWVRIPPALLDPDLTKLSVDGTGQALSMMRFEQRGKLERLLATGHRGPLLEKLGALPGK